MSAVIPKLTANNRLTMDRLEKRDYSSITQASVTNMLKKILDIKNETSKKVSEQVFDYEVTKFPKKTPKQIETYISKKLDKSDKVVWRESISDYTSFPNTDKGKSADDKDMVTENLEPIKSVSKQSGSSSELDDLLDRLLSGDSKETVSEAKEPFSGEGRTFSGDINLDIEPTKESGLDFSNFFKTGSKAYTENKDVIDKMKSVLNEKSLADGSWLTKIGSLEVPELAVLQSVVNMTPLGFSKSDKDNLTKLLSRDPTQVNQLSTADTLKLVGKLLVNPDSVGTLIKTRVGQMSGDAIEGLDKFYRKVTGKEPKKDSNLGSLEDIVNTRREKTSKSEKRQQDLDRLNGKEVETKKPTPIGNGPVPIDRGGNSDNSIFKPGGVVYDTGNLPVMDLGTGAVVGGDKSSMTAEKLLRPPAIPGYSESTGGQDAFSFLKGLVIPDMSVGSDKEKYLNKLKTSDPKSYSKYQDAMQKYNNMKKKIGLTKDSNIDLSLHKEQLKRAFDFSRQMLQKASSLKELTSDQIETLYDVSGSIEDAMTGSTEMTYSELSKVQRAIFSMIPQNVLADADTESFVEDMRTSLGASFDGDSKLGDDYDYVNGLKNATANDNSAEVKNDREVKEGDGDDKIPDEPKPQVDPETQPILERAIGDGKKAKKDFPHLRPRLFWGGEDEDLTRDKEEVETANIVLESLGVVEPGWGNGSSNTLFKLQENNDRMRYGMTFDMPKPYVQPSTDLPSGFIELTRPRMISQHAPNGVNLLRDSHDFGQYLPFSPAFPQSVYPEVQQNNANEYPHLSEDRSLYVEKGFSFVQNSRWVN